MDSVESYETLMARVRGVEPYESAFQNALLDIIHGPTAKIRWEGRRAWMAFMREHVADYLARWPWDAEDLLEMLEHQEACGRGRPSYREDLAAVLARVRQIVGGGDW
jgi:hypothetical protein